MIVISKEQYNTFLLLTVPPFCIMIFFFSFLKWTFAFPSLFSVLSVLSLYIILHSLNHSFTHSIIHSIISILILFLFSFLFSWYIIQYNSKSREIALFYFHCLFAHFVLRSERHNHSFTSFHFISVSFSFCFILRMLDNSKLRYWIIMRCRITHFIFILFALFVLSFTLTRAVLRYKIDLCYSLNFISFHFMIILFIYLLVSSLMDSLGV